MKSRLKVSLRKIRLDLKVNWKLSRNETLFKENYILTLIDHGFSSIGEVAPNIRYNETTSKIESDFKNLEKRLLSESIESILQENNFCNSFNFALDSAFMNMRSHKDSKTIYELLKLSKPKAISTSYTVPIMPEEDLEVYLEKIKEFEFIKIKVNKDNAVSFCKKIASLTDKKLRVDGNEAWDSVEDYLVFEKEVSDLNIEFIEQPFSSDRADLYLKLKPISKFMLMADESITSKVDFDEIENCFHGINVKLMKARSFENAVSFLEEARKRNLKTMLGCMIETSLGISFAMNLYELVDYFDLDGSLLLKSDPYDFITLSNGKISFKP